jgi:hypothetical protein
MTNSDNEKEIIMYSYVKDGLTFHTPNEQIASIRSDSGEYFIEIHNKQVENNLKDSE